MRGSRHEREPMRLHTSPPAAPSRAIDAGVHPLGLGRERDGLLSVPPGYRPDVAAPLLVLLHGAGADAACLLPTYQRQADAAGVLVLAPDSRNTTWDMIHGEHGPDVAFLDAALERVFSACAVRPDRIAIGGFSDGASYALSLGLANGSLFADILAFSPGFAAPPAYQGKPRVFISHGAADTVLPIDRCGRVVRARLMLAGYEVLYREFDGGHRVPAAAIDEAFRWWLGGGRSP
jgi:phospholipase/carboxylesterase